MAIKSLKPNVKGLTLLEVTIGMVILTVGLLSFIGVMGSISQAVHVSKARSLAVNLAQEKIESLKNVSYYRLMVSSATSSAIVGSRTFLYDTGYYPPEDLVVGQIQYKRGVLVQKVTESTGTLVAGNWFDADTGLKLITSYVVWGIGTSSERMVSETNLRDNPNRLKMDASFSGTVLSGVTPLQNATVVTLQNPLFRGNTNSSGFYSITVSSGSYELKASKTGYFPATITSTVAASASQTVNFNLTLKGTGSVTGTAYIANHLLLAGICAGVNGDDLVEYVELYNPTESTYTFSNAGTDNYRIEYVRTSDNNVTIINPNGQMCYVNTTIYPHQFYVVASSGTADTIAADAYYSDATHTNVVPVNRIPISESGGIRLVDVVTSLNVDQIGWGHSGGSPYGPAGAREGSGFRMTGPGGDGLALDEALERMAYSTSTAATMTRIPAGAAHFNLGNAYDSNDNGLDWVDHTDGVNDRPNNSSVFETPQTGTPAAGAIIFIDDGLSSSGVASSSGAFSVTSIATGTWSVLASSSGWSYSRDSILSITNGVLTSLGSIILNSASSYGYASGRVVNTVGVAINSIAVQTSGGSDTTDSNGYYRMRLDIGTYTIVANSANANPLYTIGQATSVVVNAGVATDVSDIVLYQGGKFRGFITTNGTDPLPGVPVIAAEIISGVEIGESISDSQGYFNFADLPTDTYVITPQLETGESVSPAILNKTVVANSTVFAGTFTVTNGFGTLSGVARANSSAVTTGILLMAVVSPNTVSTNPPALTSSLRSGSTVYYSDTSDGDGNYQISMRAGSYNVYGWYTTYSGNTPTTTKLSQTATVTAGANTTLNFDW